MLPQDILTRTSLSKHFKHKCRSRTAHHLLLGVAKLGQVVDAIEDCPLASHAGILVVLLAVLIDGEPLEDQPLRKAGLQGADLKHRVHMQLGWAHGGEILLHAPAQNFTPVQATLHSSNSIAAVPNPVIWAGLSSSPSCAVALDVNKAS